MIKYKTKTKNETIADACLGYHSHAMYEVLLILTDNGVLGNNEEMEWLATGVISEIEGMYLKLSGETVPFSKLQSHYKAMLARHKLN